MEGDVVPGFAVFCWSDAVFAGVMDEDGSQRLWLPWEWKFYKVKVMGEVLW